MLDPIVTHYKLIILIVVIAVTGIVFYKFYQNNRFRLKTKKCIGRISYDFVHNVTLDNGVDQYAQFDYIALTQNGVVVIDVKNYSGHIFGAEKIDEWTQIINKKSYKFDNPFFDIEHKLELLKDINKDINITGLILFTDEADFPKGCPDNVISLKDLKTRFAAVKKRDVPAISLKMWEQIKNNIQQMA